MPATRRPGETKSLDQPNVDPTERAELAIHQVALLAEESKQDKSTIIDLEKRLDFAYGEIRHLNTEILAGKQADRDLKDQQAADVAALKEQIKSEVKAEVKAEFDVRMKTIAKQTTEKVTEERVEKTEKDIEEKQTRQQRREIISYVINALVLAIGGYVVTQCGVKQTPPAPQQQAQPALTNTARSSLPQPDPNNPAGMPNPR